MEEDEWRREKERTADGSAKKRKRGGGDVAERSPEGAKIRRVLEDEKKQDKTSTKV